MAALQPSPIYDELLDLLAESADVERVLAFRLPPARQAQLDELLQRSRDGTLTPRERGELEEFERLEHVGRMRNRRVAVRFGVEELGQRASAARRCWRYEIRAAHSAGSRCSASGI